MEEKFEEINEKLEALKANAPANVEQVDEIMEMLEDLQSEIGKRLAYDSYMGDNSRRYVFL